jgi:hypothetical protein
MTGAFEDEKRATESRPLIYIRFRLIDRSLW